MSNYTDEVYVQSAVEVGRQRDERNRAVWENEILDAEDTDVSEGESFYQRVLSFCQNEITRDKFDFLAATCPRGFDYTSPEWHRGTKEALIKQLLERKRQQLAPHGELDPRDAIELRNFEISLHGKTKKELRAMRSEIKFRSEIRTADEAREWLRRNRLLKEQQQYFAPDGSGPYPRLAKNIVPVGFVTSVPLDAKYLRELASQDMAAFQRMIRRYHVSQINERLASGESRGE